VHVLLTGYRLHPILFSLSIERCHCAQHGNACNMLFTACSLLLCPFTANTMRLQVRPFINEAHYYADATIMFPVWPPEQQSVYNSNNSDTSTLSEGSTQPRTVTGWGLWLAQALWKEVQLRCAQCDSAPYSVHGPLPILAHSLNDIAP